LAHGEAGSAGRLVPLTVDGLIHASSMVLLESAGRKVPVPPLARWLLGLGVAATLAANVAHGLGHGPSGAVGRVACGRTGRLVRAAYCDHALRPSGRGSGGRIRSIRRPGDGLLQAQAAEAFAGEVEAGRVPSVRTIRARRHVGQPGAQRVRAYLTALINA
jgi:hypothetical protein